MKKTTKRWVAVGVLVGASVALATSASAYSSSGWIPNNACYRLTVGGASILTSNIVSSVTATETPEVAGSIGLNIRGSSWTSTTLWKPITVTKIAPKTTIADFIVYH